MAVLTAVPGGAAVFADSMSSDTKQYHALGTVAYDRQGGIYRYANIGATASVAGSLYQSAAPIAAHLARTAPVVPVGAKTLTFTPGATGGAANLYAEGYLFVDTGAAAENGYIYLVSGHPAITASVAFTLTLQEGIQVALSASSAIDLVANTYQQVIVAPTTLTAQVAGFAVSVIAAGSYGWLKTRGPVAALINGTPAVSAPVVNSATTAGGVDVWTAAAQPTAQTVGKMMQLGVSGKNNAVMALIE